jgi:hypothetical protein
MRTTITIDDHLLSELKSRAAARGTTVSRLIEDSVRLALSRHDEPLQPGFELVTYGQGGKFTEHDIDKAWKLIELDDARDFGS